jgi:hypothetical protein
MTLAPAQLSARRSVTDHLTGSPLTVYLVGDNIYPDKDKQSEASPFGSEDLPGA